MKSSWRPTGALAYLWDPWMVCIPGRGQVPEQRTTSALLIASSMTHNIPLLIFTDHGLNPLPTEDSWRTFRSTVRSMWGKGSESLRCTRSNALLLYVQAHVHKHTCLQTHPYAHKVPPAASGRLNHALIKPWSEFELEHYPLTVINAAALLGAGSEGGTNATHTDAGIKAWWQKIVYIRGWGLQYLNCMNNAATVW